MCKYHANPRKRFLVTQQGRSRGNLVVLFDTETSLRSEIEQKMPVLGGLVPPGQGGELERTG